MNTLYTHIIVFYKQDSEKDQLREERKEMLEKWERIRNMILRLLQYTKNH